MTHDLKTWPVYFAALLATAPEPEPVLGLCEWNKDPGHAHAEGHCWEDKTGDRSCLNWKPLPGRGGGR